MLSDKDGRLIGPVVPISKQFVNDASVALRVDGRTILLGIERYREGSRVALFAGYRWVASNVSFLTTDCTGQAYIHLGDGVAGSQTVAIVYRRGGAERVALSDTAATPSERAFRSYFGDDRCVRVGSGGASVPVAQEISAEQWGREPFHMTMAPAGNSEGPAPLLRDRVGTTVGLLAPRMSRSDHFGTAVLNVRGEALLVGLTADRVRRSGSDMVGLLFGVGADKDEYASSGLNWALGFRNFSERNCSGTGYIGYVRGIGVAVGSDRLAIAYRSAGAYLLAVSEPTAGNLSVRKVRSTQTPLGACVDEERDLLAVPIERVEPLGRHGVGPFFVR